MENHTEIIGVTEEANTDYGKLVNEISTALRVTVCVGNAFCFQSEVQNKPGKIVLKNYVNKKTLMDMTRMKKLKANNVNIKWKDEDIYIIITI